MDSVVYTPEDYLFPTSFDKIFGNNRPVHVDVGAGKGRFLQARAERHPELNFLGIERQLVRIRKMDKRARKSGTTNIRLLRLEAYYTCRFLLPPASVSAMYVLFPDPWPKKRHQAQRLFSPDFMAAVAQALVPAGCLHFATDHLPYFTEVVQLVDQVEAFSRTDAFRPEPEERTNFELLFMNTKPIGRMSWKKIDG